MPTETQKAIQELCDKAIAKHEERDAWLSGLIEKKYKSGSYELRSEEWDREKEMLWESERELGEILVLVKKLIEQSEVGQKA